MACLKTWLGAKDSWFRSVVSKHSPWMVASADVRSTNSQTPPQTYEPEALGLRPSSPCFNKPPGRFSQTLKLESHWIKASGFKWCKFSPVSLKECSIIPLTGRLWTNAQATAEAGCKLFFPVVWFLYINPHPKRKHPPTPTFFFFFLKGLLFCGKRNVLLILGRWLRL